MTATCNPLGALKWKDEYNQYLAGFHCVILPDNDETGTRHAELVAKSLSSTADRISILSLPRLAKKGDVSDWLAKGNTREDLYALLDGAEIYTDDSTGEEDSDENELPERYFLTSEGLFYQGENAIFISSPLRVTADTCDKDNTSWGRLLEFEDHRGVLHKLVVPMSSLSGDGLEVRSRLMDSGLKIFPSTKSRRFLLQYLLTSKPREHVLCVSQLGWHDESFVLPGEVFSLNGNGQSLLLQNVDLGANKFAPSGTLDEWQDHRGRLGFLKERPISLSRRLS